jgi:hypothetical protein
MWPAARSTTPPRSPGRAANEIPPEAHDRTIGESRWPDGE